MSERWLLLYFFIIIISALVVLLYPLRSSRNTMIIIAPFFILIVCFSYWRWGGWHLWNDYVKLQSRHARAEEMLRDIKSPNELIQRLKRVIATTPNNARGWYLLGRLYASQMQWKHARTAFAEAHRLAPNNAQMTVNYVHAAWEIGNHMLAKTDNILLKTVLRTNPSQSDALAMLAMDAYTQHKYDVAIKYWEELLKNPSLTNDDARAIRRAITRALGLRSREN